jgi:hypothetical protein
MTAILISTQTPNAGLQLRRAITIQAERIRLLKKDAIAPSAARLCYALRSNLLRNKELTLLSGITTGSLTPDTVMLISPSSCSYGY